MLACDISHLKHVLHKLRIGIGYCNILGCEYAKISSR